MKISKRVLVVAAGMAIAGLAHAEEAAPAVAAQKSAGLKTIAPDLYGNVQVRHTTDRVTNDGDKVDDKARLTVRPQIGTTLFDGAVDTYVIWIFQKTPAKDAWDKTYVYNETYWYPFQGKAGDLDYKAGTYSYFEQAQAEHTIGLQQHGLYAEVNYPLETTAGKFTFAGLTNPVAEWMNNDRVKDKANSLPLSNRTSRDADGLGLTTDDSGNLTTQQKDPSFWTDNEASAKFAPGFLPAASVGFALEYIQHWTPKYALNETGDDTHTDKIGYRYGALTLNKFVLGYKVSDKVSLSNSTRYHIGGFYQSRVDETKEDPSQAYGHITWENRLALNVTLF